MWVCPRDNLGLSLAEPGGRPKGNHTKSVMFICLFESSFLEP